MCSGQCVSRRHDGTPSEPSPCHTGAPPKAGRPNQESGSARKCRTCLANDQQQALRSVCGAEFADPVPDAVFQFSCLKALLLSPTMAVHRRWCPGGNKQLSRLDSEQQLRVFSRLLWLAPPCARFCARSGLPTRASSGRGRVLRSVFSSARRAASRGGPRTRGTHGATVEWDRSLRGKL